MELDRISKANYYINIARAVSMRSTCLRRQYGAVIVKNDEIIATGYNGAPRSEANCCDVGECWRELHGIPHGEQYEKCVAVHAEQNAIISADRSKMIGSTLYLWGGENGKSIDAKPCEICARLIKNAGISNVVTSVEGVYYDIAPVTLQDEVKNLIGVLEEDSEWCDANEWDIPICMGTDIRKAISILKLYKGDLYVAR